MDFISKYSLLVIYTTVYITCICEIENVGIGNLFMFVQKPFAMPSTKCSLQTVCFICDGNDFIHLLHSSILSKTWYREIVSWMWNVTCKNCLYFSSSLPLRTISLSIIRNLEALFHQSSYTVSVWCTPGICC